MGQFAVWFDIPVTNMERAVKFYNAVFGIEMKINNYGTEQMACFPNGEGALSQSEGFTPSANGTIISLLVPDSVDSALERCFDNGGAVVKEKTKVEAPGREYFALIKDTEGNVIGIYGK